ncbi:MAG: tyrosine-type recombinase/integrase [Acidimicrobiia bacterium]
MARVSLIEARGVGVWPIIVLLLALANPAACAAVERADVSTSTVSSRGRVAERGIWSLIPDTRRMVTVDRQFITPTRGEPRLGPPKRPASNRVVPLPSVVADELAAHLGRFGRGPEGLIFTTARGLPVRRNSFAGTFRQAAAQAGVPLPERGGFHELRHHYTNMLIASGCSVVVVQKRLGHAIAQETLNTYSHLWPDDDKRTIDAVDQALGAALSSHLPTRDVTVEA